MADAKKIKIGGTWYNIKDETARNGLSTKQDKLTFDTAPTENSTNPVTSGGVKTALDAKVNKSGDTMTGSMATQGSFVIRRDNDKLLKFHNASDQEQGAMYLSNNNHQIAFRSYDDDYSNTEVYKLPAPDSLTANKTYNILTSKNIDTAPTANSTNPVTSGGVKTALDGKVSKSGDTMTGSLTIGNNKFISLIPSDTTKMGNATLSIRNNEQLAFWHRNTDSTYQDLYLLPPISSEFSGKNNYYDILTSKNPVTVAQGGTGGTDSGVKTLSGSAFTGTLSYQTIGKFGMVSGQIKLAADLTADYIDLQTIPAGSRPSTVISGLCGGQDGWGVIYIYTSGVIRFYKAQNESWSKMRNIYFTFLYFVA